MNSTETDNFINWFQAATKWRVHPTGYSPPVPSEEFIEFCNQLTVKERSSEAGRLKRYFRQFEDALFKVSILTPSGQCPLSIDERQRTLEQAAHGIVLILQQLPSGRSKSLQETRPKREEYNVRARSILRAKPPNGAKVWTQRALAKAIGCSTGLIGELEAYQAYIADLGGHKRRGQRPVAQTPAVMASLGEKDAELEHLIAEHTADFEESPLVTKRAKTRSHRKL